MGNVFKRKVTALLLVCMAVMAPAHLAQAADASKAINKVSVRVSSKLEPGSSLPTIEIGTGTPEDGGVRVSAGNSKYHVSAAEWFDKGNKELKAADEPQMRVTLEPEDVSEDYFLASYKASDVKISSGSFVSARRNGDNLVVTLRVQGIKGDYDAPKDAYWYEDRLGEARWEKPENTSGYYELQLYRDEKSVFKVSKVSAVKYNFYPYMTEAGEYTFKVRTIPGTDIQKKYGKNSDWLESGELEITDRYVSDGKGQQNSNSSMVKGTDTVGWVKEEERWIYRLPDGNQCRGGWAEINGQWYFFDMDGYMASGWRQIDGKWYYLYSSGEMAVGWSRIDGKWYYFHNGTDGDQTAGAMAAPGWQVIGSWYYFFNEDGSLYTGWLQQNDKYYYLNELDNSLQGAMFTGWLERDGKTYYMDNNGERASGWCQIDGSWHYFYPESGEMARSTQISGFAIDEYGVWR